MPPLRGSLIQANPDSGGSRPRLNHIAPSGLIPQRTPVPKTHWRDPFGANCSDTRSPKARWRDSSQDAPSLPTGSRPLSRRTLGSGQGQREAGVDGLGQFDGEFVFGETNGIRAVGE